MATAKLLLVGIGLSRTRLLSSRIGPRPRRPNEAQYTL